MSLHDLKKKLQQFEKTHKIKNNIGRRMWNRLATLEGGGKVHYCAGRRRPKKLEVGDFVQLCPQPTEMVVEIQDNRISTVQLKGSKNLETDIRRCLKQVMMECLFQSLENWSSRDGHWSHEKMTKQTTVATRTKNDWGFPFLKKGWKTAREQYPPPYDLIFREMSQWEVKQIEEKLGYPIKRLERDIHKNDVMNYINAVYLDNKMREITEDWHEQKEEVGMIYIENYVESILRWRWDSRRKRFDRRTTSIFRQMGMLRKIAFTNIHSHVFKKNMPIWKLLERIEPHLVSDRPTYTTYANNTLDKN